LNTSKNVHRTLAKALAWAGAVGLITSGAALAFDPPLLPLPTTRVDFNSGGTPAGTLNTSLITPQQCSFCHGAYEGDAPYELWNASMMGQAARDPIFWAAFSIAQQDADFIGDFCLRCHVGGAWAEGRFAAPNPTDGSTIQQAEFTGVSCSVCHRMVDPVYAPGVSPPQDAGILAAIPGSGHLWPHNANMVFDPDDTRRGPLDLQADWLVVYPPDPEIGNPGGWPGYHDWAKSPFHSESRMCATCHDVSTPTYTLDEMTGNYVPNALNDPPPVNKYHQFPEQRTFSEWSKSLFAMGDVDLGGRFGGDRGPAVSSCQDCHMPGKANSDACGLAPPSRTVSRHEFSGANSWVLLAIDGLYPLNETNLADDAAVYSTERNIEMLKSASDMELSVIDEDLNVRVINYTGHKLPTGYVEGRRMWVNVQFFAANGTLVAERGAYDFDTAELTANDTKVYEAKHGLDATAAALSGEPEGEAFRLALVNKIIKDNRIPPMGYSLAEFQTVQAQPVPSNLYADGQYWDDTLYAIPAGAAKARVTVYHQTTTKEYIEFLRDEDQRTFEVDEMTQERIFPIAILQSIPPQFDTPFVETFGQLAYNLWNAYGKSAPVEMDKATIVVGCLADWDGNQVVQVSDIFAFLAAWFAGNGDFNDDGINAVSDIFAFLAAWFAGCN
jgi:hypothetical protein